jgi:hypothetical protein
VIDSLLSWIAQQRQPQEGAFDAFIFGHKQSRRATTTKTWWTVVLGRLDEFIVGVGFADG